jgi:formylmethanofuran dehydrogenase subunit E
MLYLERRPAVSGFAAAAARVGILVTGTEVFMGLVEDKFIPIITTKVEQFGGHVQKSLIVPDERRAINEGVKELLDCGIDLLVTTAGLSVTRMTSPARVWPTPGLPGCCTARPSCPGP